MKKVKCQKCLYYTTNELFCHECSGSNYSKFIDEKEHTTKQIKYLKIALNLTGIINIDYEATDLFLRIQKGVFKKQGDFSLDDVTTIVDSWKKDYKLNK